MSDGTQWFGTKEAAERIGVTVRTLYKLADEGQLPMYKVGRVFRVRAADVEAFLDAARVKPGELSHLYPDTRT